jgi:hypothetical protein
MSRKIVKLIRAEKYFNIAIDRNWDILYLLKALVLSTQNHCPLPQAQLKTKPQTFIDTAYIDSALIQLLECTHP